MFWLLGRFETIQRYRYTDTHTKADKEAQGAQGLNKDWRELLRLIRGFRNKYNLSPSWEDHVCMVITYSKGKDQPGKVGNNPARGQLNKGNEYFPVLVRA